MLVVAYVMCSFSNILIYCRILDRKYFLIEMISVLNFLHGDSYQGKRFRSTTEGTNL